MDENIQPRILSNETKPLFIIEPFDFAAGHIFPDVPERADSKKRKGTGCSFSLCPNYRFVETAYDSIDWAESKRLHLGGQVFVMNIVINNSDRDSPVGS